MICGIPRNQFGVLILTGLFICFRLRSPEVGLPVPLGLYFLLRMMYAKDPYFVDIYVRNIRHNRHLDT
jgi:type IV secretory pathway TrbD component